MTSERPVPLTSGQRLFSCAASVLGDATAEVSSRIAATWVVRDLVQSADSELISTLDRMVTASAPVPGDELKAIALDLADHLWQCGLVDQATYQEWLRSGLASNAPVRARSLRAIEDSRSGWAIDLLKADRARHGDGRAVKSASRISHPEAGAWLESLAEDTPSDRNVLESLWLWQSGQWERDLREGRVFRRKECAYWSRTGDSVRFSPD